MKKYNIKRFMLVILSIFIITFNISCPVNAETNINFKNITIEDGLSQGSVEALFQDSDGYIWIGTNDGLNRYNGYEYEVYRQEPDNRNSIVNNYILDIKEDKEKNIWVATANGLSKIHKDRVTITNYLSNSNKGNLSNANTNSILITNDNRVIVGTADGLNVYVEEIDSFERILLGDKLTNQNINSVEQDVNGDIWIGTKNGLNKIDVSNKSIEKYSANDNNSIIDNSIYKVYYDYYGYIWIGTYESGISKINITTNEITNYSHDESDIKSLPSNEVKNFLRDSYGSLWIATSKGLAKLDEKENKFINNKNKIYDNHSLVNDNIFSLIEDESGLVWVGTYAGISRFNPRNKIEHYKNDISNENSISSNMILSVYEDDGLLWVGTSPNGLNIINRETNTVSRIKVSDYNISSNIIYDITGNDSYVILATNKGVDVINKKDATIKNYNENNGIPNNKVKNIYIDSKENLWIGTVDGLCVLNMKTGKVEDLTPIIEKYSPEDKYIGEIFEDSNGDYWIGTFVQGGLLRLNKETQTVSKYKYDENNKNSLSNDCIRTITEDESGNLWIGTNLGVSKLLPDRLTFQRFSTKDGLVNNTIYGILIDSNGNPWMSTNVGISKIDITDNSIINLDVTDGLQSNEFNGEAYYKNENGEFIFGGINGINIFNPKDINVIVGANRVLFDEFEVNGIRVNNIDGEKFKRNEKNITAKVFVPNYKNSKAIQYYYKIEGLDDSWKTMSGNSVTISNLRSGNYTLKIVAKSGNGIMTEENSVSFEIKQYFLLSEYSIIIYLMAIALWIYNNRRRVKRLDKLVKERTKELSIEMQKNQELFNKLIKLEKTKNNYFVNLSHELRTPLNVIHATEQLINKLNASVGGIEREKLNEYMNMLGNNVQRLLKIINDLIDTSKIENGNYKINFEKVNIVYVVEEAALSLKNFIESKNIELIIDPEIEEKIIMADSNEIERCIVNIVGNAAKFTQSGGRIRVSIKDIDSEVMIEIEDNGRGIEKEYHNVIFNRFTQIIDEQSEVKGGSGLGLTITKQIIDLHNGEIFIESEVNKGSKFTIILPAKQNN